MVKLNTNPKEISALNFRRFHKYKNEKSYLILLICKY